jgi:Mg2+ and Co2+ transporter CorA
MGLDFYEVRYRYFLIWGVMTVVATVMIIYFKRENGCKK